MNTLTIVSTFKMWKYSPFAGDGYPVTDGTLHVKYEHYRSAYSQVKYKDFILAERTDDVLLDINKAAYIKIDDLSTGDRQFLYDSDGKDEGYKNINSHIEEVKAKVIEAIPEAKEATNIVVEHGAEGAIGILGPFADHFGG